jgi:hypothetical protein
MKPLFLSRQLVLCILVMFLSTSLLAMPLNDHPKEVVSTITYTGIQDQMIVFDIVASKLPAKSTLRILNEEGVILHEERIDAAQLMKRYKIVPAGLKKVHFEIVNKQVLFRQSFDIQMRVEEKLTVTATPS